MADETLPNMLDRIRARTEYCQKVSELSRPTQLTKAQLDVLKQTPGVKLTPVEAITGAKIRMELDCHATRAISFQPVLSYRQRVQEKADGIIQAARKVEKEILRHIDDVRNVFTEYEKQLECPFCGAAWTVLQHELVYLWNGCCAKNEQAFNAQFIALAKVDWLFLQDWEHLSTNELKNAVVWVRRHYYISSNADLCEDTYPVQITNDVITELDTNNNKTHGMRVKRLTNPQRDNLNVSETMFIHHDYGVDIRGFRLMSNFIRIATPEECVDLQYYSGKSVDLPEFQRIPLAPANEITKCEPTHMGAGSGEPQ